MKRQFILLNILLLFAVSGFIGCNHTEKKKEKTPSEVNTNVYECPMKCNNGQTYDKPGTCPVCGMELEKEVIT